MDKVVAQLIHVDYFVDKNRPVIRLLMSDDEKRKIVVLDDTFEPYFYTIPAETVPIEELVEKIMGIKIPGKDGVVSPKRVEVVKKLVGIEERTLLKITCYLPSDVPKLREAVAMVNGVEGIREFDILFHRRYMIDRGLEPLDWYEVDGDRILYNDFPCDTALKARNIRRLYRPKEKMHIASFDVESIMERGEMRLIMAGIYFDDDHGKVATSIDVDGRDFVERVVGERGIIEWIVNTLKMEKPHLLVTYNGDAFDFRLLKERASKLKMELKFGGNASLVFKRRGRTSYAEIEGIAHIDLYPFVSTIMAPSLNTEVFTLEAVCQEILGEGKYEVTWEEIEHSWKTGENLERIVDYNYRDVELTMKLAKALLPNIFSLASLAYMTPVEVARASYSQLVENFAIRKAYKMNYVVPNKPTVEEMDVRRQEESYEGAIVIEPKPGLHEDIAVFDFRSLYPSIIITHNIDPFTINCKCCTPEEAYRVPGKPYYFCKKKRGFIPTILQELIEKRMEIKKKLKEVKDEVLKKVLDSRQQAMKTVANAFYGYLAFVGSRFYDKRCAESVTAFGRYYITMIADMARQHGFEVIYGDTDSIFLKMNGKKKEEVMHFLEEVNSKLSGIMELEFEGFYKRGLFVRRKTGEGGAKKRYALIDEYGKIVIRGFERVRRDWSKLARETQEKVLYYVLNGEVEKAVEYVRNVIEKLKKGDVDKEDLCIYTTITRSLDSYEQIGPHVAAARKAMARGVEIRPGETIKYIITRGVGSISDRAELAIFAESYDPDYYIRHQVLPAAMRVLSVLGYTEDMILSGTKQTGLFQFMKK